MPDVTVITVTYSSAGVMPGMIASLPAGTPLVIVNNGPDDGIVELARSAHATLIEPGRNLGFAGACNIGAADVKTEFLLFLNPDTRVDPTAIPALLTAARDFPQASAFGPVLLDEAGHISFKRRSFLNRADAAPRDPGLAPLPVPSLSGAAMLIRRAAFEAVGGFDPAIFLYYEDDDLAFRLRRDQGPLILVPAAKVYHASGQSSPPSLTMSRFKGYHRARSRILVARKHGLPRPWVGAMKSAIWHLIRPKSWSSPERRAEAIGRVKGVWSALRS